MLALTFLDIIKVMESMLKQLVIVIVILLLFLSFVLKVQVTVKHMLQATCTSMSPIYLSFFISLQIMHIHYPIRF
jgi:hypothetical protein